jgi:nitroreductase
MIKGGKMEVLQAISNRRSHRAYKKEQLPDEVLSAILKAGLEAPSARNRQPWHYSVVQNPDLIQEVHDEAAKNMTAETGSPRFKDPGFQIFYHAPTVVFLFADKEFYWSHVDCGIAVENMALAAEGLGVGSVILGLPLPAFKGDMADELRARLGCPQGYDFVVALALGYATDNKEAHDLREENISRIF